MNDGSSINKTNAVHGKVRKICTVTDAERDGSTKCQELKEASHLVGGLSHCEL